ncbi:hypothetical protein K523DRAFT_359020 [Schizophyllum commune Tattone D]|nr:hypothetical protein K523DRAFT_359020 [Schizophyllum commune Tattone D]
MYAGIAHLNSATSTPPSGGAGNAGTPSPSGISGVGGTVGKGRELSRESSSRQERFPVSI